MSFYHHYSTRYACWQCYFDVVSIISLVAFGNVCPHDQSTYMTYASRGSILRLISFSMSHRVSGARGGSKIVMSIFYINEYFPWRTQMNETENGLNCAHPLVLNNRVPTSWASSILSVAFRSYMHRTGWYANLCHCTLYRRINDSTWNSNLRGHSNSDFTKSKLETSKIKKKTVLIYITVLPLPS